MIKTILLIFLALVTQMNCQKGDYNFTSSCNDCEFSLKWDNNGNSTNFVFTTKLPSEIQNSGWAAFSFSKDLNMGHDDMHVCKSLGANSTVEHYYKSNVDPPALLDNAFPAYGLTNIQVKLNKQMLTCSFTRVNKMIGENYFSLPNKYNLLLAYGSITNG